MVGRVLESVVWVALGMDFHLFFVVFFPGNHLFFQLWLCRVPRE